MPPQVMTEMMRQALLEDSMAEGLNFHDGMDRFQRTRPAVPEAQGNHIFAEHPRYPHKGKQYIPVRYVYQEYPRMIYQQRLIDSVLVSKALEVVIAETKDKQKTWDGFLDRLLSIQVDIDFRQLALPSTVPDGTALRLLKRTLILQIQAAEREAWKTKNHPKTFEDYKLWANSPISQIVNSEQELKAIGKGWFLSPDCKPETEINNGRGTS
jgi:hypothetical protein